eukprot:COSAG01_NODE_53973_length_335_cov_0.991525_1_plen_21_part_01
MMCMYIQSRKSLDGKISYCIA